jgi:urea transporter
VNKFTAAWEEHCVHHRVLRFIDINLRGVGQVMFQDNPLSGLLFLAAIAWGSWAARLPHVALAGAVAVVVSTATTACW